MNTLQANPQMVLRIIPRRGKERDIPVETLNQASQIWDRLRLEKGWRASTAPDGQVLVGGLPRGYLSLNGRVWQGAKADLPRVLIFDPAAEGGAR